MLIASVYLWFMVLGVWMVLQFRKLHSYVITNLCFLCFYLMSIWSFSFVFFSRVCLVFIRFLCKETWHPNFPPLIVVSSEIKTDTEKTLKNKVKSSHVVANTRMNVTAMELCDWLFVFLLLCTKCQWKAFAWFWWAVWFLCNHFTICLLDGFPEFRLWHNLTH